MKIDNNAFLHAYKFQKLTFEKKEDHRQNDPLIEDKLRNLARLQEVVEDSKNQSKKSENEHEILEKCLEIFRRIVSGDKVPMKDHRYLSKHRPELYGRAILMRTPKKNPIKYKQLSKDEDNKKSVEDAGKGPTNETSISYAPSPPDSSPEEQSHD